MNKIVLDNGQKYSDLKASDEWVAAYKKSVKESSAAYLRKKNKKVFVRDASQQFKGIDLDTQELERRTGILVYGYKEDQTILGRIWNTVMQNKLTIRKAKDTRRAFMVIQVAKSSEKDIIPDIKFNKEGKMILSKIVYWKDFLKTKFFRKIETSYYIYQQLNNLDIDVKDIRRQLLYKFEEDYEAVVKSYVDYNHNRDFTVNEEYLSKNYIQDMLVPLRKFEAKHIIKLPELISQLSSYRLHDELLQEALEYLKFKGFKLQKKFYLKDSRQLEYESNLINMLRNRKPQFLLTYTLNQTENVNETSTEDSREETSSSEKSRSYYGY